jgi:protein SCO1/2
MKQRTYLARYGETQNTGWHFLTAHESSIQQLTDSAGFHFQRDPMTGEYMHPSGIIVLSPSGKISQYFFGIQFDPTKLHLALQKARAGKLGSWIDDILLYCFHYRPRDTKIGQQVMLTIRIAAGLGALMLCAFLAYLALSQQKMIERRAPQRGIKK